MSARDERDPKTTTTRARTPLNDALRLARKRWGKSARVMFDQRIPFDGYAHLHPSTGRETYRTHRCKVGRLAFGMFEVKGQGPTFAAADAADERDHARYVAARERGTS